MLSDTEHSTGFSPANSSSLAKVAVSAALDAHIVQSLVLQGERWWQEQKRARRRRPT